MRRSILTVCLAMILLWNGKEMLYAAERNDDTILQPSSYRGEEEFSVDSIEKSGIPRQRSGTNLETSYVSPYITSVKNQGSYGTCWAFSMVAAAEANMIKKGLASKDVDLSEWQIVYFMAHSVADPLGGTAGDGLVIKSDNYLNAGGNQQLGIFQVANWCGLVDEETAPYTIPCEDLSAKLPDEAAYSRDVAHLENSYWVSMQDKEIIKQLIKEYGACGAAYYSDGKYYNKNYYYNTAEELAMYCPEDVGANHGITIVGWDDNYSRENFNEKYRPEGDGAWYCKNSWGTQWSKDGYFWISYEDVPLSTSSGYFYDYGASDNYDHNYQYDGGAWGQYYPSIGYEANIYQAKGDEWLRAVGFYTQNTRYQCTVSIYKNCEEGRPTSGELVATKKVDLLYAGFHTVELEEAVSLCEGDSFSVVINQTTADGAAANIFVDSGIKDTWCENVSTAQEGQSYILHNDKWLDIGALRSQNCRIKAYTDDAAQVREIRLDCSAFSLYEGESRKLGATILPAEAIPKSMIWSSSDENVVMVSEDGTVTAKGCGEAVITCRLSGENDIKAVCTITVVQPEEESSETTDEQLTKAPSESTGEKSEKPTEAASESTEAKIEIPTGSYHPKGEILTDRSTKARYKVTKTGEAVEYMKAPSGKTSITIPATVKIDGISYKVTSIGANAFKNNKKIKKVVIGKNVTAVGKKAFYNCKNLSMIMIKTSKLTIKRVGSKAFKGIHSKAVIKVPKKKQKEYRMIFKSKVQSI